MVTQAQRDFHNAVRAFRQKERECAARWDKEQDFWYYLVCQCGRHFVEPSTFKLGEMRTNNVCKMCGRRFNDAKTGKMPRHLLLVWDEKEVKTNGNS